MPKKRRRSSRKKKSIFSWAFFWKISFIFTVIIAIWVVYLDFAVRAKFDGKKWAIPARVYAQPLELYEGLKIAPSVLERELKALGYRPISGQPQRSGLFAKQGLTYQIYTKGFTFWDKAETASYYEVQLDGTQVIRLTGADDDFVLRLEPQEIGSIYPNHGEDRILARLSNIPPLLGETLIAVEDKNFIHHHGISFKGIARAMLANVKAGGF
ncbi:MAG: transglycosylase domain-containing protein, partial [Cellvibrionaceae bacterium]